MKWLLLICTFYPCVLFAERNVEVSEDEWSSLFVPPYKKPKEVPVAKGLRQELFKLLRDESKTSFQFQGSLRAFKNWALFTGRTVDKQGSSIKHPPHENDDAVALWLHTRDGWKVVDYSFGHSDAFYFVWSEQYGVPKALLGIR